MYIVHAVCRGSLPHTWMATEHPDPVWHHLVAMTTSVAQQQRYKINCSWPVVRDKKFENGHRCLPEDHRHVILLLVQMLPIYHTGTAQGRRYTRKNSGTRPRPDWVPSPLFLSLPLSLPSLPLKACPLKSKQRSRERCKSSPSQICSGTPAEIE